MEKLERNEVRLLRLAALKAEQFNYISQGLQLITEMPKELINLIQSFLEWIPTNEWQNKERMCNHGIHLVKYGGDACDLCNNVTIAYTIADGQGTPIEINTRDLSPFKNNYFVLCLYCSLSLYQDQQYKNKYDIEFIANDLLRYNCQYDVEDYNYNHEPECGCIPGYNHISGCNCTIEYKCTLKTPISYLEALRNNYIPSYGKFTIETVNEYGKSITYTDSSFWDSESKRIKLNSYNCQLCGLYRKAYVLIDSDGCDRTYCSHFSDDWFVICHRCVDFEQNIDSRTRGEIYYEFNGNCYRDCNCSLKHQSNSVLKRLVELIEYVRCTIHHISSE